MTTEQCIEIAEKVWGWPTIQGYWVNPETEKPVFNDGLREEVNSWQGFGRTVEAMAEKDNIEKKRFYYHLALVNIIDVGITKSVEEYWEATHLAALEALK